MILQEVSLLQRQFKLNQILLMRREKKKVIKEMPNGEELATKRLFQISTMWQQQEDDKSKVLTDHSLVSNQKTSLFWKQKIPVQQKIGLKEWKLKSMSLGEKQQLSSIIAVKEVSHDRPKLREFGIFNKVSSNRVFVGGVGLTPNKKNMKKRVATDQFYLSQRRVITISSITSRWKPQPLSTVPCHHHCSIWEKIEKRTQKKGKKLDNIFLKTLPVRKRDERLLTFFVGRDER